jgi:hypothetical protein
VKLEREKGGSEEVSVGFGHMKVLLLGVGESGRVVINPSKGFDVGAGHGKTFETKVEGGVVGLIIDCRGRRPFLLPLSAEERVRKLNEWNKALNVYPERK